MKAPMPQYVVANTILDANTLPTAKSLNDAALGQTDGTDLASACCTVTLALSAGEFPIIDLDACFAALEAQEVHHYGPQSACVSLFDAAAESFNNVLPNQHHVRMATMALSTFFSPSAPVVFAIAPHLLFGDTKKRRDSQGNRYRARCRVTRKGPLRSSLLLEWELADTVSGLLITGERFLESLLQVTELVRGGADTVRHTVRTQRRLSKTA